MIIINDKTKLGGMTYPFFGSDWEISIEKVSEAGEYRSPNYAYKTMAWTSDGKCSTMWSNEPFAEFKERWGFEFSMKKGALQLSKRMSRVFRPMFYWDMMFQRDVNIVIDKGLDKKTWDGAGVVSRKFVERVTMGTQFRNLTNRKKAVLWDKVKHARRVEFTVLNHLGELKGHAVISDDLDCDLIMPDDVKGEIKMNNGKAFVSFDFPHAADHMMVDSQSLINLGEFFPLWYYQEEMAEYNNKFLDSLEDGTIATKIASAFKADAEERWWLPEYFASGGGHNWFRGPLRSAANQHVRNIEGKVGIQ